MKTKKTWILIADGARAHIVTNLGPGMGVEPLSDYEYAAPNAPTRDFGSDKPGRTHKSGMGAARHAMEPRVDWHEYEKTEFAKRMAAVLNRAAEKKAFDSLILVAPPKTLGDLRGELTGYTLERVGAEINKELTHVPLHDLADHLREVMRL